MGNRTIQRFSDCWFAIPNFATGFDWYSQGTIFRRGQLGSIVEIRRIWGMIFNSKEAAEQHGLELCKDWIDKWPLTLPNHGVIGPLEEELYATDRYDTYNLRFYNRDRHQLDATLHCFCRGSLL